MNVVFDTLGSLDKLKESYHAFSSQRNDFGNQMMRRMAPKDRTYSSSRSCSFRIEATIGLENGGNE